jgi:hypothetical protein
MFLSSLKIFGNFTAPFAEKTIKAGYFRKKRELTIAAAPHGFVMARRTQSAMQSTAQAKK